MQDTQEKQATPEDLDLLSDLADAGKSEADIWAEMDAPDAEPEDTSGLEDEDQDEDGNEDQGDEQNDGSDDIWSGATEEQRAAFEAVQSKLEKRENDFKSVAGRVSAYQSRYEELKRRIESTELRDTDTREIQQALGQINQEYPEIGEPLTQALRPLANRLDDLSNVERAQRDEAQREIAALVQSQTAQLSQMHPDYVEALSHDMEAFQSWIDDQPRAMRDAFSNNKEIIVDAESASMVVSAWKSHIAGPETHAQPQNAQQSIPDSRRQRQLAGAAAPSTNKSRPTRSGIPQDGISDEEMWRMLDAEEARRKR